MKKKLSHRYRIDFVDVNRFATLRSIRLTRRNIFVVAVIVAAIFGLSTGFGLRGGLDRSARTSYINAVMAIDSLSDIASSHEAYIGNIRSILAGEGALDDHVGVSAAGELQNIPVDSLAEATAAERRFVERYAADNRYNLSVLAPIAADGMSFVSPVAGARVTAVPGGVGISSRGASREPVSAVYRGSVIACTTDLYGLSTIVVQHPNDFVSVYTGVESPLVSTGDKVRASQRVASAPPAPATCRFELWHAGTAVNPLDYLPFND